MTALLRSFGTEISCTGNKFLVNMVGRDLKVKNRRSKPSIFWNLLSPSDLVAIYYFVFKVIMKVSAYLAVADTGFQKKCLNEIERPHAEGRTLLLINHDPRTVESYCTRCIVIDKQEKIFDGKVKQGTAIYRSLLK